MMYIKADGVPEPEYTVHPGDIMIKFTAPEDIVVRRHIDRVTEGVTERVTERVTDRVTVKVTDRVTVKVTEEKEIKLIQLLLEDPAYTYIELAEKLGVSRKTISKLLKSLKDKQVIMRIGSDKKGYWELEEGISVADIKLFKIKPEVKELAVSSVALERDLQTLLENNMQTFLGVTFLKSEYSITSGRIDSIGIDENNCPVIIEYKRSMSENVINQGLFYLDWLLDHKADFKLLVIDELGMDKANEIDWSMPCVICVANDFTKYDEHAVNQMQKNIRLVRYKLFDDDLILLEQVNNPRVAPIKEPISKELSTSIKGKTDKTFDEQLATADPKIVQIYENIHDYIMSLGDDVSENRLKHYSAYKKLKNIVCLEIRKRSSVVYLKLNPSEVELVEGFCRDVSNIGHWGTGDVELTIKEDADFVKAKDYILKSYQMN